MRFLITLVFSLLPSIAFAQACPSQYRPLSPLNSTCAAFGTCEATNAACHPINGCAVRVVSGTVGATSSTGLNCPSGSVQVPTRTTIDRSVVAGQELDFCVVVPTPVTRLQINANKRAVTIPGGLAPECGNYEMTVTPPAGSGLDVKKSQFVVYNVINYNLQAIPAGVYIVKVKGLTPRAPCPKSNFRFAWVSEGSPNLGNKFCVSPPTSFNQFTARVTPQQGCGNAGLTLKNGAGQTTTVKTSGSSTASISGPAPIYIDVLGDALAPKGPPCNGFIPYTLEWSVVQLPSTPSGSKCSSGYTELTRGFKVEPTSTASTWGANFQLPGRLCFVATTWFGGFNAVSTARGASRTTARYTGRFIPPTGYGLQVLDSAASFQHRFEGGGALPPGAYHFNFDNSGGSPDFQFYLTVDTSSQVPAPTVGPAPTITPRPGASFSSPTPADAVLALPPAPGTNIGNNFTASITPSYSTGISTPIVMALFYYSFDGPSARMTDQPPDFVDFGYTSQTWFNEEVTNMTAAGVDVVLPVYGGFPNSSHSNNVWANGGLTKLATAVLIQKNTGGPWPRIGMALDSSILQAGANPIGRLDLTNEQQRAYWIGMVRDFWSQIPEELWAQIDFQPIIVLTPPATTANATSFTKLKQYFRFFFPPRSPFIIADSSWSGVAGPDATTNFLTSLNGPSFSSDVAQLGPGFDDSRALPPRRGSRPRNNGDVYRADWDTVIAGLGARRFIILETWNNFFNASEITPSLQHGTLYGGITNEKVAQLRSGTLNAEMVSQTTPFFSNQMVRGATGTAVITMRNTGTIAWAPGAGFELQSQTPTNNTIWGQALVQLPVAVVASGQSVAISVPVRAPNALGSYTFQWRMIRNGIPFGSASTPISVTVVAPTPTPTGGTPTPGPTPVHTPAQSPSPTPELTPPPFPAAQPTESCPAGYFRLQPPFGVPGVCYERGNPDRPIKTPDAGRCPDDHFIDVTPWGEFCRPISEAFPTPRP